MALADPVEHIGQSCLWVHIVELGGLQPSRRFGHRRVIEQSELQEGGVTDVTPPFLFG